MQGIFVSYRRQDSQSAAGRLTDHLRDHLSGAPIFRDVETIEPGVDFVDSIERALQSCAVLIAVIGPRWVSATDDAGRRRLDNANDYTRLEIATALKRKGVRVIPVLVEGATMPAPEMLPPDLEGLARRNAIELTDKRWEYDVMQLVTTLRSVLGLPAPMPMPEPGPTPTPSPPPPAPQPEAGRRRRWWIAAAVLLLVVIGYLIDEQDPDYIPTDLITHSPPAAYPQSAPAGGTAITSSPPPIAGLWRDPAGGQYEIAQQGSQIVIQGAGPDGYVAGSALLSGFQGQGAHTLNGYPLQSNLQISGDGMRIDVGIVDPATGQRSSAVLLRVR